jgi:hypothetical protein
VLVVHKAQLVLPVLLAPLVQLLLLQVRQVLLAHKVYKVHPLRLKAKLLLSEIYPVAQQSTMPTSL